jgi:hypothetical protein
MNFNLDELICQICENVSLRAQQAQRTIIINPTRDFIFYYSEEQLRQAKRFKKFPAQLPISRLTDRGSDGSLDDKTLTFLAPKRRAEGVSVRACAHRSSVVVWCGGRLVWLSREDENENEKKKSKKKKRVRGGASGSGMGRATFPQGKLNGMLVKLVCVLRSRFAVDFATPLFLSQTLAEYEGERCWLGAAERAGAGRG